MIIVSDNFATNILINLYGFDYYNNYFKELRLVHTKLNRLMGIYNLNIENYTSNQDMYNLYKMLATNKILNKELCDLANSILRRQRGKKLSQRYIYEEIEVYHKTGGLSRLKLGNDCGDFVLNNHMYYFGIFLEQVDHNDILIGKIFSLIYEELKNIN